MITEKTKEKEILLIFDDERVEAVMGVEGVISMGTPHHTCFTYHTSDGTSTRYISQYALDIHQSRTNSVFTSRNLYGKGFYITDDMNEKEENSHSSVSLSKSVPISTNRYERNNSSHRIFYRSSSQLNTIHWFTDPLIEKGSVIMVGDLGGDLRVTFQLKMDTRLLTLLIWIPLLIGRHEAGFERGRPLYRYREFCKEGFVPRLIAQFGTINQGSEHLLSNDMNYLITPLYLSLKFASQERDTLDLLEINNRFHEIVDGFLSSPYVVEIAKSRISKVPTTYDVRRSHGSPKPKSVSTCTPHSSDLPQWNDDSKSPVLEMGIEGGRRVSTIINGNSIGMISGCFSFISTKCTYCISVTSGLYWVVMNRYTQKEEVWRGNATPNCSDDSFVEYVTDIIQKQSREGTLRSLENNNISSLNSKWEDTIPLSVVGEVIARCKSDVGVFVCTRSSQGVRDISPRGNSIADTTKTYSTNLLNVYHIKCNFSDRTRVTFCLTSSFLIDTSGYFVLMDRRGALRRILWSSSLRSDPDIYSYVYAAQQFVHWLHQWIAKIEHES